jgi:hypothetical protein
MGLIEKRDHQTIHINIDNVTTRGSSPEYNLLNVREPLPQSCCLRGGSPVVFTQKGHETHATLACAAITLQETHLLAKLKHRLDITSIPPLVLRITSPSRLTLPKAQGEGGFTNYLHSNTQSSPTVTSRHNYINKTQL